MEAVAPVHGAHALVASVLSVRRPAERSRTWSWPATTPTSPRGRPSRPAPGQAFTKPIFARLGTREPFRAQAVPYFDSTDHLVFNDPWVRVPGTSLTNWPDEYIHSSVDDLWQIDPTQLKRNAFVVAATAWWLANAGAEDVPFLASFVAARSAERLARDLATAQAWTRDGKGSDDDRRRAAADLLAVAQLVEAAAVESSRAVGPSPIRRVAGSIAGARAAASALAASLPAGPASAETGRTPAALTRLAARTPRFAVTTLDAWMALEEEVKDKRDADKRVARRQEGARGSGREEAQEIRREGGSGRRGRSRGRDALTAHGHRGTGLGRRQDQRRRDRPPRLRGGPVGRLVVLRGDDIRPRREVPRDAGQGRPHRLVTLTSSGLPSSASRGPRASSGPAPRRLRRAGR